MLDQYPRLPVTDAGVIVPKTCFGDAKEVSMRQENGHVVLEPVARIGDEAVSLPAPDPDDPIWKWGSDPLDIPITDASANLDNYLYGSDM